MHSVLVLENKDSRIDHVVTTKLLGLLRAVTGPKKKKKKKKEPTGKS